jgi:hypothetical protein
MIEAIITISPASIDYALFLLESIKKTISDASNIKFLLVHNKDTNQIDKITEQNKEFKFKKIKTEKTSGEHAGHCHAHNLNAGIKELEAEYGMIIDADCALLQKNWDTKLISLLNADNVIVGAEYDGKKYKNFPNSIFCMFKTKTIQKLGIDFAQAPTDKHTVTDEEEEIYGRQKGEEILLDVGWQLPVKIKGAGYKGVTMPLVNAQGRKSREGIAPIFMKEDMRGEEYQINNVPLVTHVGRSSTRPFSHPIPQLWKRRVEEWIK